MELQPTNHDKPRISAPREYRTTGVVNTNDYNVRPQCFKQINLEQDWHDANALHRKEDYGPSVFNVAKAVITKERHCEPYTDWHPGKTPKEQDDMAGQQLLLDIERAKLDLQKGANDIQAKFVEFQQANINWQRSESDRNSKIQRFYFWTTCAAAIISGIISGPVMDWLKAIWTNMPLSP